MESKNEKVKWKVRIRRSVGSEEEKESEVLKQKVRRKRHLKASLKESENRNITNPTVKNKIKVI